MAGVSFLILRGGLFGNPVPARPGFRPDDRRQDAAAESRIDLLDEAVKDRVGITAEEFFFVSDTNFFKLAGKNFPDIGQVGQTIFAFLHDQMERIPNALTFFH